MIKTVAYTETLQQTPNPRVRIADGLGFIGFIPFLLPVVVAGKYVTSYRYSSWDLYFNDLQALLGAPFSLYFQKDKRIVWNRANWNICKRYSKSDADCSYNKSKYWFENQDNNYGYITFEQCEKVFQTYINLVSAEDKTHRIEEYNPQSKNVLGVVSAVANASGQSATYVKILLDEAFYASQAGALNESFIIKPLTYLANAKYRDEVPKGEPTVAGKVSDFADNVKQLIDDTISTITTVLVVGGILLLIGVLVMANSKKAEAEQVLRRM